MPDRDEQTPENPELRDVEDDAREAVDLPEGSNPDSPHHASTKKALEDAKSDQPED